MEYVTYILIILGIMGLCHYLLRNPKQSLVREKERTIGKKIRKLTTEKKSTTNGKSTEPASAVFLSNREALNVPTPWGWPGHGKHAVVRGPGIPNTEEVHDVSESLHRFVDRLVSGKETVENAEYLLRKNASLRALIEDRYGRALKTPKTEEQKFQEKLLRSPSATHQVDSLHMVKTPWGW